MKQKNIMKKRTSKKSNSHLHFNHRKHLLKCKRSQAHVEMILSFVIFVGFIVTMLIILSPVRNRQISYTILDITEEQLLERLSINYTTLSLTLTQDTNQGTCFSVPNTLGISADRVVKDQKNIIIASQDAGGRIVLEKSPNNVRFYNFYISESFNPSSGSLTGCVELNSENYTYGVLNLHDIVLYENIENFSTSYNDDYEELRKELDIQNDFAFFVYNETGILFQGEIYKPRNVQVVSRNLPIRVMNKNAEVSNLIINLQAWS